ncbi:hypothetical protein [Nonomuraea candida]|uniref:hypothetical protein n=1 Tax=Nonomuraea candida TaxID=359159 RepID=UPI0005B79B8B|nr:hypothetical protein [Nonomuraea candida]
MGPPVAAAAIGLALAGYLLVPARYVSTASMVLTISTTGGTEEAGPAPDPGLTNPLMQFGDALRAAAGILILTMRNERVATELGVAEGGPTTVVVNDGRTDPGLMSMGANGPYVHIEVESTSAATARDVMAKAQRRVRTELTNWQTSLGAPPSTHLGILDVRPTSAPRPDTSGKLTAAAGGAVLGLLGGLAAAYATPRLRPAFRPEPSGREAGTGPEPPGAERPVPGKPAVAAPEIAFDPDPMQGTLVKFGHGPVGRPPGGAEEAAGNGSRPRLGALSRFPRAAGPDETDTQTFPQVKPEDLAPPDETDTQTFPVVKNEDEPDGDQ